MAKIGIKQLNNSAATEGAVVTFDGTNNKWSNNDTGAVLLPKGTTAERPASPEVGHIRYNTDLETVEYWDGDRVAWIAVSYENIDGEPTGFVNRTDSEMTFNGVTREFTISPLAPATSYVFYVRGKRYEKTTTDSITIPATSGGHYIFFNPDGTLGTTFNAAPPGLLSDVGFAAFIYYDAVNQKATVFSEERHGLTMDNATHAYLHLTRGAAYSGGLGLNTLSVDQDGSLDTHAQFGVDAGLIFDEDLDHSIAEAAAPANIPILYRAGTVWTKDTATAFPVKSFGTGRLAYNSESAGTYSQTEVTSGNYVLAHIMAVGGVFDQLVSVQGVTEYTSIQDARIGALTEFDDIESNTSFPFVEFRHIATLIYETSDSFTNQAKARVVSATDTKEYFDFREGAPIVDEITEHQNVVYVGKHGADNNSGLEPDEPKLTLKAAIDHANSVAGVNNKYIVKFVGAGTFQENNPIVMSNPYVSVLGTMGVIVEPLNNGAIFTVNRAIFTVNHDNPTILNSLEGFALRGDATWKLTSGNYGVEVIDDTSVTLQGMEISDCYIGAYTGSGTITTNQVLGLRTVSIKNCQVAGISQNSSSTIAIIVGSNTGSPVGIQVNGSGSLNLTGGSIRATTSSIHATSSATSSITLRSTRMYDSGTAILAEGSPTINVIGATFEGNTTDFNQASATASGFIGYSTLTQSKITLTDDSQISLNYIDQNNNNIVIDPQSTGNIHLDRHLWPNTDGASTEVLTTDGLGNLYWATVGGGQAGDMETAQARRTTTLTLGTTWADVDFDTTDVENDVAVLNHDNTNRDRIAVGEDGLYAVYYNFDATNDIQARVRVNDTNVLAGSEKAINSATTGQCSAWFVVNLVANDFLTVQTQASTTTETVEAGATFIVTKLEGPKGDTGPAGPGFIWEGTWSSATSYQVDDVVYYQGSSYIALVDNNNVIPDGNPATWELVAQAGADGTGSVNVEEDNVAVGAFSTLNFTGSGVSVVDAGAGQTDITITSGAGASPQNLIYVAKNGNDTTGDGSFGNPYLTIEQAITDVVTPSTTNRYAILVGPGVYSENNPLTLPQFTSVQGIAENGIEVVVEPQNSVANLFELDDNCVLQGLVLGGISTASLVYCFGTGAMQISDVYLRSGAKGLQQVSGFTLIDGLNMSNNFTGGTTMVSIEGGSSIIKNFRANFDGAVTNGIVIDGATTTAEMVASVVISNNQMTNAITVSGGAKLESIANISIKNTINGVVVSDASDVQLAQVYLDCSTYDVNILDQASTFHVTNGHIARSKTNLPANYQNFLAFYEDDTVGDSGFVVDGEFAVGRAEKGSETILGQGDAYIRGLNVLTSDGTATATTDGGNITDVTANVLVDNDGLTTTFQGTTADHCIYFGSELIDATALPLKHYGLKLDIDTGANEATFKSFIIERWNGTNWAKTSSMASKATAPYQSYSNALLIRSNSTEHIRYSLNTATDWERKIINGKNLYWTRIRITDNLIAAPTINQVKLHTSHSEFSLDGFYEVHGLARWKTSLYSGGNGWGETGGITNGDITVGSGALPSSWSHNIRNSRLTKEGDALYLQFVLPQGICTSCSLQINVKYQPVQDGISSSGTMIVSALPQEIAGNLVVDPVGGIANQPRTLVDTEAVTSKPAQVSTLTLPLTEETKIQSVISDGIDIEDYFEGDMVLVRIEYDNAGDINKDIVIWSVDVEGVMWKYGEHLDG